jgi:hypothetical protein
MSQIGAADSRIASLVLDYPSNNTGILQAIAST